MVRKINNRLYKINTYASEMIVEVDDNYDEEVQKLKKEIQLDSLGCKLNLLVYLAELSVQGYAISSVTEFNSNGTKPRVAYANVRQNGCIVIDGALLMTGCMMENLPMWIFQMILLIASLKNGRSQWD